MRKILNKMLLNMTFIVIVMCGLIFTFGFGSTIFIARNEITKVSEESVKREISHIQDYVDDYLLRVEDAAYGFCSWVFGRTERTEDGDGFVSIDPDTFKLPTMDQCYHMLKQFMEANPQINAITVGFEQFVYPNASGQFGFAPYMRRMKDGSMMLYDLGEYMDYSKMNWYNDAKTQNKSIWCNPFREPVTDAVITAYSVPLHGYNDRVVGVLILSVTTDTFREKCLAATPYERAEVTIVDKDFNFMVHPNPDYLLKSVSQVDEYTNVIGSDDSMKVKMLARESGSSIITKSDNQKSFFFYAPVNRTGWMISIECPESEVLGGVDNMKKATRIIGILSVLLLLSCLIVIYIRVQKVTASKASIERDLTIASHIQMGMVPKLYPAFPERKELDVYGLLRPAKTVGGDLYDYFIQDDKFYFCIGDVSGKGVPASLFMTVTRSLFRNIAHHISDPSQIMVAVNDELCEGNDYNMFCTMFLGILDLKTGNLQYCNAGHNPPVLRLLKDGNVDVHYMTPKTNLALGVMPGFVFQKEETVLKPGEAIFLYTDGVTEAENARKELFGEEATLTSLSKARAYKKTSSRDFVEYVYHDIEAYCAGVDQSDDITMLVVEYKGR